MSSPAATVTASRRTRRSSERIALLEARIVKLTDDYEASGEELLAELERERASGVEALQRVAELETSTAARERALLEAAETIERANDAQEAQQQRIRELEAELATRGRAFDELNAKHAGQREAIGALTAELVAAETTAQRLRDRELEEHPEWGWATEVAPGIEPVLVRSEPSEQRARQAVAVRPGERTLCSRRVRLGPWQAVE